MTRLIYGTARRLPRGQDGLGFEYGNTRLRAQRSRLLSGTDYRELFATGSTERLLGALSATPYAVDAERALIRHGAIHWLDETVRGHLTRSLRSMRAFYDGDAGAGVDLLLARWDLRNLQTIIRLKAGRGAHEDAAPMLVAAGTLDEPVLVELAAQPSLRTVVELMVAWELPTRPTARQVLQEWPRYEATGDPAVLERALQRSWAAHTVDELEDWAETALASILQTEIDQINVMTALRLRQNLIDNPAAVKAPDDGVYLPGGGLPRPLLEQAEHASTPAELAALFEGRSLPDDWLAALQAWTANLDLSDLAGRLERALARNAIGLFSRGDPLGIAIPVAFVWAKECEARNLRLVDRAITHQLAWDDLERRLYPW